ncbi:hypothetical protein [Cedecea colo]|uniref:Uncharacterized protein n=1 Tax=Cedecea colo TaxID=2552946 RepID=A0ABX0VMT1_9ENTR|nr:hypothetical protein [Cedecea colo]NIY48365.1 hypothetical protein [Cedecea colo]
MRSYASNLHYGERRRLWQWVQAAVPGGVGLSIVFSKRPGVVGRWPPLKAFMPARCRLSAPGRATR